MVVKSHELVVHDDHLVALGDYIQHLNENPNYLPPTSELIIILQDIINCLAWTQATEEQMGSLILSVEEYILRILNAVNDSTRSEIITAILDKFYSMITDPQTEAGPATCVVLVVFADSGEDAMQSAARWLVQQNENGSASAGLKTALSCLFGWMCVWRHTLVLADWVMSIIKALQEKEKYEILVETSLEHIEQLFLAVNHIDVSHENLADVIFHVLASLRESAEAFDRISRYVSVVLTNLAEESGQWSRHLLQMLVDILTTMIDHLYGSQKEDAARENFRLQYYDTMACLEKHMPSRTRSCVLVKPWRLRSAAAAANAQPQIVRIGLLNLGNTCYMNSVMQALLVTRQFSNHVMLRMTEAPYWSLMGELFAKMMYSLNTRVNPDEFFSVVKPPFFTKDNQHDSSEFLGYLLLLLQSYEHYSNKNFDYTRPAIISNAARLSNMAHAHRNSQEPIASASHAGEYSRPGSSDGGSSCNPRRRILTDNEPHVSIKRRRFVESFIDNIFGGILHTRIQCAACHYCSVSRDVFRDLQLAFPDKPEGTQHSVQALLDYYCSKERMSGDNKYRCRGCNGLCEAERTVIIETAPKYLILVLKNFKFEPKTQLQTKLMLPTYHNQVVTVPIMRSICDRASYSLYATIVHDGTTLNSGHYYTLVKENEQWIVFNDDIVTVSDDNMLTSLSVSSTPYIMFYKRADVDEGVLPSVEDLPASLQEAVMAYNKSYVESVRMVRRTRP